MNVVAQILGIGAMISLFSIYQQNERKKLLAAKLCADVFWVAHYLCLGGTAGMIPNFIMSSGSIIEKSSVKFFSFLD